MEQSIEPKTEELHQEPQEESPIVSVVPLAIFHVIMMIVALAWSGEGVLVAFTWSWNGALLGVGAGIALIAMGKGFERYPPLAKLKREIAKLLGGWEPRQMLLMLCTGVMAEELFFRGALLQSMESFAQSNLSTGFIQDAFALIASSLIFGVVHGGLWGKYVLWSVWATGAGLVFGGLMVTTNSLWSPIIAHGIVNAFYFWSLKRTEIS